MDVLSRVCKQHSREPRDAVPHGGAKLEGQIYLPDARGIPQDTQRHSAKKQGLASGQGVCKSNRRHKEVAELRLTRLSNTVK